MHVSLAWLKEFVDVPTDDVEELTNAFNMLGLAVESVEILTADWTDVFVGEVLQIDPHPSADKVRVCQVDIGSGPTQIICGAWNFEAGVRVPVAVPGAVLPGGFEIGTRSIRGVESHGMICSEQELGLGDDHAGILVLDGSPEIGAEFSDTVELPDMVFELDVTPNRPDALSIIGVARDLAAWFDVDYRIPPMDLEASDGATSIRVDIQDTTGCRRFTAREIVDVTVSASPLLVRHRLHKVGIRPISNVVDATNYVMLELGHPLHAFDADSIEGDMLVIKRAEEGETLETLDGETRELVPEDLIIYDESGPTSMSGTMGGARSEVSDSTTRVLMEAASWDPPTIMHMWRRHDLRSEAATRFERGVDTNLADVANQRASEMVRQLAGGSVLEGSVDEVAKVIEPLSVDLHLSEVTRLLGEGFERDYVASILQKIGMTVEGDEPMSVVVPTNRPDISLPADLIEEIARIHGFQKFKATVPTGPAGGLTEEQRRTRRTLSALSGLGLHQAIHLPFVSVEDSQMFGLSTDLLSVKNPLREEESKLRQSLLPGLLGSLRNNQSRGIPDVALFEIGSVFYSDQDSTDSRLPRQAQVLAWAVVGGLGGHQMGHSGIGADGNLALALWRSLAAELGLPSEIRQGSRQGFHPGRTAEVGLGDSVLGHVGELLPSVARAFQIDGRVAVAELDLSGLVRPRSAFEASEPSPYPPADFDLSFAAPVEVTASEILAATQTAGAALVESAHVFDEYRGEGLDQGQRALAIRYRLRAGDRTLDADDISRVREAMIEAAANLDATLRGK